MEEICETLAQKIAENGGCGYCVFYEDELFDGLPDGMRDRETLAKALKRLSDGGYIDIKYAHGSAFCIAALKNFEKTETEETGRNDAVPSYCRLSAKERAWVLFAAFSGGLLSGIICCVAGAIL